MAYKASQPLKITLEAAADLSAKQYHFVKVDSSGKAAACSGATDVPIGVLQNDPTAGQTAEIVVTGVTKISSDAALNEGDLIGTSADGQADAKTPGTDTTNYVVGQMMTATGAAGVIGTALVNCANPHRAA
jgi:Tol biopolymer transport system component